MIKHVFARCEFLPGEEVRVVLACVLRHRSGRGCGVYLHILHRIRLLGMMTGDSEGDCGCPANMSAGGAEPSPSKMIRSSSYMPGG